MCSVKTAQRGKKGKSSNDRSTTKVFRMILKVRAKDHVESLDSGFIAAYLRCVLLSGFVLSKSLRLLVLKVAAPQDAYNRILALSPTTKPLMPRKVGSYRLNANGGQTLELFANDTRRS